jgi:hypothetical protein
MFMPEAQVLPCPDCQLGVRITLQSELQAGLMGTTISCPHCGTLWLLRKTPYLVFSPLVIPKTTQRPGRKPFSRPNLELPGDEDDELSDEDLARLRAQYSVDGNEE